MQEKWYIEETYFAQIVTSYLKSLLISTQQTQTKMPTDSLFLYNLNNWKCRPQDSDKAGSSFSQKNRLAWQVDWDNDLFHSSNLRSDSVMKCILIKDFYQLFTGRKNQTSHDVTAQWKSLYHNRKLLVPWRNAKNLHNIGFCGGVQDESGAQSGLRMHS